MKPVMDERVYISTREIADLLGWTPKRARRWLKKENACIKIGDRWYTTKALLHASFPEVLDAMLRGRAA